MRGDYRLRVEIVSNPNPLECIVDAYFHNYRIDLNTRYFLYIGELKNYGLNIFLKEALSRIWNQPVDFIAVVPDILEQYANPNVLVINPLAMQNFLRVKQNYSCRVPGPSFMREVSENPHVIRLINNLLERQDRLYIYMYESLQEMSLDDMEGVEILGPKSFFSHRLNNKIYQYNGFKQVVNVPEFEVCLGWEDLQTATEKRWDVWKDGIFVTTAYSAAGANSVIAHCWQDVLDKFKGMDYPYLISRYHPHVYDPTVLAVVANEADVYVAGVADQRIEGGNRFTGSTYPSALTEGIQHELFKITRRVGRLLGKEGYRGIFGCDYVVDEEENIVFVEVNARKQGTTLEFCCTLEQLLPSGAPMLPELEYYAVVENRFPENTIEPEVGLTECLHWGTYNFKLSEDACVQGFMPYCGDERQCYGLAARENASRQFVVLEHIGNDFVLAAGSFLGRVVAMGMDPENVQLGLLQGKAMLEATVAKYAGRKKQ